MKNTKLLALLSLISINSVINSMEKPENIVDTSNQSYLNEIIPNELQLKIINDIVKNAIKNHNYKSKHVIIEKTNTLNNIIQSLTSLSRTNKHFRDLVIYYVNNHLLKKLKDNNLNVNISDKQKILLRATKEGHIDTVKFIITKYGINATILKNILCQAIEHKQEDIKEFLKGLGNKNVSKAGRNNRQNNVFLSASIANDINEMKKLIKTYGTYNIDSCKRGSYSETALQRALKNDNIEMAQLLITHGANVNFINNYVKSEHILINAIKKNNINLINLILKFNPDINCKARADKLKGNTALMCAVSNSNISIVKLLIQAKADVNAHNEMGQTALEIAIELKHEDIISLLIENQANIDVINPKTNTTMLQDAIKNNNTENLILLLKLNANPNGVNHMTETPLMYAIKMNNISASEFLIKAGADINIKNQYNNNALVIAAMNNHIYIVELLLKAGINPDNNIKAFGYALDKNNLDMAKLILINTPETYISKECIERVMLLAILNKNKDIIDMFKSCGRINQHFIAHVCLNSMLIISTLQGRLDIVKQLINNKIINKQIGKINININFIDLNGNTALINATKSGYTQIVQLLLDAGADINIKNKFNKTALDYAIELGHMDIITIIKNSYFSIKRIKTES